MQASVGFAQGRGQSGLEEWLHVPMSGTLQQETHPWQFQPILGR